MKVGILTYHRSHNYGAVLQAVALRTVLKSIGYCVFYVDYFPDYHKRMYSVFDWGVFLSLPTIRKKIRYCLKNCRVIVPKLLRKQRFNRFLSKHIVPFCLPVTASFDVLLYGSDQVWRKQPFLNQYNPVYFGDNTLNAHRHISYAASLSSLPSSLEDVNCFLRLLKHLDLISVREEATRVFLIDNGISNVRVDLDPVLLLQPSDWVSIIPERKLIEGRYVLLYDLQSDAGSSTFDEQEVRSFANNNQCQLVRIRGVATRFGSTYDRHLDGPGEFVNLIRYSDCVVTSSYHGLVFSLLFNRPVICRYSHNSERFESFLNRIGARDVLVQENDKMPEMIRPLDPNLKNRIAHLRQSSFSFLKELLVETEFI